MRTYMIREMKVELKSYSNVINVMMNIKGQESTCPMSLWRMDLQIDTIQ